MLNTCSVYGSKHLISRVSNDYSQIKYVKMSDQHQNRQKYIVAARYNLKTQFIFLQELSLNNFLDQCAIAFNFNCNKLKLNLTDNRNAPINRDNFNDIVQTFASSASFFVNIDIVEQNANVPIVSVKCLEDFFVNENAGSILQMQRSNPNYNLSKNQLNFVIRLLGDFTQQRFGATPSPKQKEAAAKTFVELFPSVHMTTLLNASDGGKLSIQLRNKRANAKRQHVQQHEEDTLSEQEAEEMVEVLKSTVVNSQNMDNIKAMLKSTLKYRTELLKKEELNLREYFPYFWISKELVLFEFYLRYPHLQKNAFFNKWNKLSVRVIDLLATQYGITMNTLWSTEIGSLLGMLKILPAKAAGNKVTVIENAFKKAEQKLIVFRKTNHPIAEWEEKNNKYPYILAFGDSKSKINHYLIELEREFFCVPHDSTIGEVFELFFMLHKIFKMQCDPNLERLFNFFEHFIFEMDVDLHSADNNNGKKRVFKPTTAMQLLFNQLNNDE